MSEQSSQQDGPTRGWKGRSPRQLVILAAVGLYALLFVVLNDDKVEINFVLFSHRTSVWVALLVAAGLGFAAGYLVRHRRTGD
jgi:hypothetical protein